MNRPKRKPDKTGRRLDGRFAKGFSGNPDGRPIGSRNKTTIAVEALLDGDANALTEKAIALAKTGDMQALRLCMERIVPARKDRPVTFEMPEMKSADDAASAISSLLASVARGDITPAEASEVSKIVDVYVRAMEASELIARLEKLERKAP